MLILRPPRQPARLPSTKHPVIPAPKGMDAKKEERRNSVLQPGTSDDLSDTNVIPVALLLTESEVSQVNKIAMNMKLPRHQVLTMAVQSFLRETNRS